MGFGIHSPFAYDFVVNVLREKNHYYAYDIIRNKHQRLLYRIVLRLAPSEVIAPSLPAEIFNCLPVDRGRKQYFPLYVVVPGDPFPEAPEIPFAILFIGMDNRIASHLHVLMEEMEDFGMVFCNPRNVVVVADPRLPRQNFNVNF